MKKPENNIAGIFVLQASVLGRYNVAPKTAIQIELGHTEIEIDITMIDRIHDVLLAFSNDTDQPRPSSQCFPSAPMHTNEVSFEVCKSAKMQKTSLL